MFAHEHMLYAHLSAAIATARNGCKVDTLARRQLRSGDRPIDRSGVFAPIPYALHQRPMSASSTRPTVAVIGSGLAGLTTAYILRREGCEVYLIEKVCT
jgi:flavin-dependent dehydrogenase